MRGMLVAVSAVRVGVGVTLLTRPSALPRSLGVDSLTASRVDWLGRMLGVRDVVLGFGGLRAAVSGRDVRDWVHAGATADAVDALAIGYAVARRGAAPVTGAAAVAIAAGAAMVQLRALRKAAPE